MLLTASGCDGVHQLKLCLLLVDEMKILKEIIKFTFLYAMKIMNIIIAHDNVIFN